MDAAFRRPGRFDLEIEVPVPEGPHERLAILRALLATTAHTIAEDELREVAEATHGFVGADLSSLLSNAGLQAVTRACPTLGKRSAKKAASEPAGADSGSLSVQLTYADVLAAMRTAKPSSLRTAELSIPTVKWGDIGGQERAKELLREAVSWPLKYGDLFRQMGIRGPRGLLLFGPPGCSKTLMAKALANESGLNFLSVKVCTSAGPRDAEALCERGGPGKGCGPPCGTPGVSRCGRGAGGVHKVRVGHRHNSLIVRQRLRRQHARPGEGGGAEPEQP